MNRNICVCLNYLTEDMRTQIRAAAERTGFSVRFFEDSAEAAAYLPSCEVLFGQSPALLRAAPATLQWYCCAYAGVDPYCKDDGIFANPACLLTNSSGAYGLTIAEHIITVSLMMLRRMPEYAEIVGRRSWKNDLTVRSLCGTRITVLGTGDIGCTFALRARAFAPARITGVSRSGKTRQAVYDEMLSIGELDQVLPRTDLLVMALPSTPETVGIMDGRRLALLPQDALVVNVGRGTAVDQDALAELLRAGKLGGAALDVMVPEPLPQDSPLWSTPNLLLTPHVAGNMTLGYTCEKTVEMFCENLENYAADRPLNHLVDRTRGY